MLPVPSGEGGEIVFSGICVGRGYINDPKLTAQAFLPDPRYPGSRMYRSGDFGRIIYGGKLEFLGRRDSQVKISGFRIEIGEIEERLLRLPGVSDGAVVVQERAGRSRQLVAFYTGDASDSGAMKHLLAASLPHYMVPSALKWMSALPLTGNGKIDRKVLGRLAGEFDDNGERNRTRAMAGNDRDGSGSGTLEWLSSLWADVLAIPRDGIGSGDNFFDRGGTSLSAVRLALRAGRVLSFKDIASHPVLGEQADLIDLRRKEGVHAA
jgi:hypothetical protein